MFLSLRQLQSRFLLRFLNLRLFLQWEHRFVHQVHDEKLFVVVLTWKTCFTAFDGGRGGGGVEGAECPTAARQTSIDVSSYLQHRAYAFARVQQITVLLPALLSTVRIPTRIVHSMRGKHGRMWHVDRASHDFLLVSRNMLVVSCTVDENFLAPLSAEILSFEAFMKAEEGMHQVRKEMWKGFLEVRAKNHPRQIHLVIVNQSCPLNA